MTLLINTCFPLLSYCPVTINTIVPTLKSEDDKSYIFSDVLALGDFDGLANFHQNHFANWLSEGHLRENFLIFADIRFW